MNHTNDRWLIFLPVDIHEIANLISRHAIQVHLELSILGREPMKFIEAQLQQRGWFRGLYIDERSFLFLGDREKSKTSTSYQWALHDRFAKDIDDRYPNPSAGNEIDCRRWISRSVYDLPLTHV